MSRAKGCVASTGWMLLGAAREFSALEWRRDGREGDGSVGPDCFALQAREEGVGGGGVVDGLEDDAAAVRGAGSDGIDSVGGPAFRFHLRDAVEELGALGNIAEGTGREGVADGGEVIAKEFFGDIAGAGEPGDVVVVDPGAPFGVVGSVAHEEGGASQADGEAQPFVAHKAAGGVEPRAPVVDAGETPFEDGELDLGVLGGADVVAELFLVVLNAANAGGETIGFVLVVVAAEDVEVVAGDVDEFFTPVHVVGAFLATCDDIGIGGELAEARAVEVDDGGVGLRRMAVVHRLVVDLEIGDFVGFRVSIGGARLAPQCGGRVEEVVDPIHGVFELSGAGVGGREDDEGLSVNLPAELKEFVGAEAVVIGVAAPNGVGVHFALDVGPDAVFPLVDRGEGTAGPADKCGMEFADGVAKVGAELAMGAGVGGHEGDEIDEGATRTGDEDFE